MTNHQKSLTKTVHFCNVCCQKWECKLKDCHAPITYTCNPCYDSLYDTEYFQEFVI